MARRTRRMRGGKRGSRKKLRGGNAHTLMAQLYKAAPALALAAMLTRRRGSRVKKGGRRKRRSFRR